MPLLLSCPECHSKLRVPEDGLGKTVRCPRCQVSFLAEPTPVEAVEDEAPRSPSPRTAPEAVAGTPLPASPARRRPRLSESELDEEDRPRRRIRRAPPRSSVWSVLLGLAAVVFVAFLVVGCVIAAIVIQHRGQAQAEPAWHDFSPPDSRLTIYVPGTPQEVTDAATGVLVHRYSVLEHSRDLGMHLHYFDAPGVDLVAQDTWDARMRTGVLKDFPTGNIKQEMAVHSPDGTLGREYQIDLPKGVRIIRRVFRKNQRVFIVSVSSSRLEASMGEARTFLDSLRLL